MLDKPLSQYVDWEVKTVMHIKNGYGYRVCLKYMDGQEKVQQKSGFKTAKEAEKARERTIAELYSGTYVVYANIKVKDFLGFWSEEDIKNRVKSYNSYDTFAYIVKNHIVPVIGKKKMTELSRGDVQKLYNTTTEYSISIAKQVKTVMNISMRFGVKKKLISTSPAAGINLPKHVEKKRRGVRSIDTQKTLSMEQIKILLEKSKETPIHMQILFNVLMGLRRSEINAVKYSDVDYVNRTLTVQRQLGKVMNTKKEDFAPKTFTKQEVDLKTESSYRVLPIPDYVFEAILQEREKYEKNKSRRSTKFQDLDYICCSSYGRPRSKSYHCKYYKKLLADNDLPDIRWHDLRSTFCTLLLKNDFNPKAVSKLMGHAKEIVTIDVYGDNKGIISDCVTELQSYIEEVLPTEENEKALESELLGIVIDTADFME